MSLSPFDSFQSRFVTYLLNFPRTNKWKETHWENHKLQRHYLPTNPTCRGWHWTRFPSKRGRRLINRLSHSFWRKKGYVFMIQLVLRTSCRNFKWCYAR